LCLEALEARSLPSASGVFGPPAPRLEPGGPTRDLAYPFPTDLDVSGHAGALGTIRNSASGGGGADWYSFTLVHVADVTVMVPHDPNGLTATVTLFNTQTLNPFDSTQNDPYTPTGHRRLAQDDGAAHGGTASVELVLAPGTYYVAVSGSGDHDFAQAVAFSGETGATGPYGISLVAHDLTLPGPGPVVIAATPTQGQGLNDSPLAIRVTLNALLDPNSIQPGTNVVLTDDSGNAIQLQQNANVSTDPTNGVLFDPAARELQVFPEMALAPGTYHLRLVGTGSNALTSLDGAPLGSTGPHGRGKDYTLTFTVTGVEGVQGTPPVANDTLGTATQLNVSSSGLTQVYGTIGDDPFASSTANDVDLYQFTVTGTNKSALVASAEAARIGSPLAPALDLFQVVNGQVTLLASDIGTGNTTPAHDNPTATPFGSDAVLYAGLAPGTYYLAVGGAFNLPNPAYGIPYPTLGFYDPTQTYSAQSGVYVGDYLLSLSLHPDDVAPHVTEVDGLATTGPAMPPSLITVHFDKAMNVRALGYGQNLPASPGTLDAVWVHASDGNDYHLRLLSYDDATHVATFYLLQALPDGPASLHLAGALPDLTAGPGGPTLADVDPGLTDLAGNLIAGSANGDYVVPLNVSNSARSQTGPLTWTWHAPPGNPNTPDVIGPLFPDELGNGSAVNLLGHVTGAQNGPGAVPVNFYKIQLCQSRYYSFTLVNWAAGHQGEATGIVPRIFRMDGGKLTEITTNSGSNTIFDFPLSAGTYLVEVGPLPKGADDLDYRLTITLGTTGENAIALTTGAAPPYAITLPQPGPVVSPPAPTGNSGGGQLVLPNTSGGTGVVPAATTTISLAGLSIPPTVPSGTLAALSAPPVGGVPTTAPQPTTVADRLVLPSESSYPLALSGTSSPAVLTVWDSGAEAGGGTAHLLNRLGKILQALERAAVDRLFRSSISDWMSGLWGPLVLPELPAPPENRGAGDMAPDPEGALPDPTSTPVPNDESESADGAWAGALGAAAGLALTLPRRTPGSRRRPAPRAPHARRTS
jgi:hypothetical protein